jgi:pyruvate kinase
MIARGDLGVEIGDAELPAVQKQIIHMVRNMNRVVITATQMMQSMVENQIPTRAEVFDVANAVLDGTDAVMLSEETATGRFPVKAIEAMDRICRGAEKQNVAALSRHRVTSEFQHVDEAIAMACMYTANHLNVRVIAALTESGATTQWMSRISSDIPIYAMTRHEATRRKVALYRGVYPLAFDINATTDSDINKDVTRELLEHGMVEDGDLVLITKGDMMGTHGATNTLKIIRVGEF